MATTRSPEVRGETPADFNDLRLLEEEAQASAFGHECAAREQELKQKMEEEEARLDQVDRNDTYLVEALQTVVSIGAGGLSTVDVGGLPVGGTINAIVGIAAKVGALTRPDNRALRVVCQTGKTFLHSQIAIATRKRINGA